MSCSASYLQGCCNAPTDPTTTIRSSAICCRWKHCLPSTCPHEMSLLQPTCCDPCPLPSCIPDSYVASCWLLRNCHSTPNLSGISVTTEVQTCPCEAPAS